MQKCAENVGIVAVEIHFPQQYVDQNDLEIFDGIARGKYTIGLGQERMGFCLDYEDVNSLALTVVEKLLMKHQICLKDIGRMDVGTETIIDKSKSLKTVIMQLFEKAGNCNIEGVDSTNACYGGTAALFNAIHWMESSYWDGRYALVVAADIAVYASGNARCTGGAGAVAMLVGPNAPLVFDRGVRGTYMRHVYDFYKPHMSSEYPVVDGALSIQCYLSALDQCYAQYRERAQLCLGIDHFSLLSADAFLFHAPYCKLVMKSVGRLMLNDLLASPNGPVSVQSPNLERFRHLRLDETYQDREIEKAFVEASSSLFEEKTKPSLLVSRLVGNMYTPSLYGGLASWIATRGSAAELAGKRAVLFSYGSGLAASMFSLRATDDTERLKPLFVNLIDLDQRLSSRTKVSASDFDALMKRRAETNNLAPYKPVDDVSTLSAGTWHLVSIDDKSRRTYARVPDK